MEVAIALQGFAQDILSLVKSGIAIKKSGAKNIPEIGTKGIKLTGLQETKAAGIRRI